MTQKIESEATPEANSQHEATTEASRTRTGPGKSGRNGTTVVELIRMFSDDETARAWFESKIWPRGPFCPECGSTDVQAGIRHKTMTHRCRSCPEKNMFSVRVGSVMEASRLGYQKWAIAIYVVVTSLKSVSSMRLHRDLGITQKSAWHLLHRIRAAYEAGDLDEFADGKLKGPVEVDESFFGGKRRRGAPATQQGTVGKAIVAGAKERETGRVRAGVIDNVRKGTLQRFVGQHVEPGSLVYTDDHPSYRGMPWHYHEAVKHSVGEYVRDQAHTNGIEAFWLVLKRAYNGTFHRLSHKHLDRYVAEFVGRHNARELDTADQMSQLTRGMVGKRLKYEDLIAGNGMKSGARGQKAISA